MGCENRRRAPTPDEREHVERAVPVLHPVRARYDECPRPDWELPDPVAESHPLEPMRHREAAADRMRHLDGEAHAEEVEEDVRHVDDRAQVVEIGGGEVL